jgi:hypothetical protein
MLRTWLRHKQQSWITCGFLRSQSRIPAQWWDIAQKNTNLIESLHEADYIHSGTQLSILRAIFR